MKFLLTNSAGEPDGSWTLAVLSWAVVSLCLVATMVNSTVIKAPDTTLLLGYLAAMTGNYHFRRNKKDELAVEEPEQPGGE